jgi:TonB family protein
MRIGAGPRLCLVLLVATGAGCRSRADDGVQRVGFYNLEKQLIEGRTKVVAKDAPPFGDLSLLVTVDTTGRVMNASVAGDNGRRLDAAPALAAARQWRFRPQTFEGKPVIAMGTVTVSYERPEDGPDASVPFPQVNLADTEIVLERGACYGSCPDYRVSIGGDGTVRFSTRDNGFAGTATEVHRQFMGHGVLLPGVHVAHVAPAAVAALVEKFRSGHYFGLKPEYAAQITDNPTQALTFGAGANSKRVVDYVGSAVGMPAAVTQLEDAVDTVAGSDRWVNGNADTISWLEAEHFDFRAHETAELAAAAMQMHSMRDKADGLNALIFGLIDRGMPLDAVIPVPSGRAKQELGPLLAYQAAISGNEALFGRLASMGYVARIDRNQLNEAFASGMGCSPAIAKALVKAGADPRATGRSGTALTAIRGSSSICERFDEAHLVEMARTLIQLGVPLEARDDLGWTALMGCDSPALERLLLEHGANPNARDGEGTTPVLSTDEDRVALILLRAGADPRAKNHDGSVRQQAIKGVMPATLAWLDAHGVR